MKFNKRNASSDHIDNRSILDLLIKARKDTKEATCSRVENGDRLFEKKNKIHQVSPSPPDRLWSPAPAAAIPLLSSGWAEARTSSTDKADLYLLTSLSSPARGPTAAVSDRRTRTVRSPLSPVSRTQALPAGIPPRP